MPAPPTEEDPRDSAADGREAERIARRLVAGVTLLANFIGTSVVFVLSVWVLPVADVDPRRRLILENLVAAAIYLAVAMPVGVAWGRQSVAVGRRWLLAGRPPTPEEQRAALRAPARIFGVQASLWILAAVLFGALNLRFSAELALRVTLTVGFGGITTGAIAYLLTERLLRPVAARALAAGALERPAVPGIVTRSVLAWALGTGLPLLGLVVIGLSTLREGDFTATQLAIAVVALGSTVLIVGFAATFLAARAVADPVVSVRHALARVERGDLDQEIPVYDGSEVGLLQSGFNRMVGGLRDRERIRDLFGRHVGEDVARAALTGRIAMGGEVREVAVLFVDVASSTTLAATRPPTEVVDVLNAFFAVVVDVIARHDGWVNKFEGDAALAVFGAPVALDDAADRALAAARELATRLRAEVPTIAAGIGVAFGPAVAGNVGERRRYEYTVIGDPVNQAARLSELAKAEPGRVLANAAIVERAGPTEAGQWRLDAEVVLRGRTTPTRLAAPADV